VSSPAAGSCNCLTKSYTETGAVVFKDVCTQETAISSDKQAQAD
jgi:hypothetical protein